MGWFVDIELVYPRILVPVEWVFYRAWKGRELAASWFESEKENGVVLVLKKWPVQSERYAAGTRHWFAFRSRERVRGGVYVPAGGERRLHGAIIKLTNWGLHAEGWLVLEKVAEDEYRVAREGTRPDAVLLPVKHFLQSRSCAADMRVEVVEGEARAWCDATATRIDSVAACTILARPGAVLRITTRTGEYRGDCWETVEEKRLVVEGYTPRLVDTAQAAPDEVV